MAVRTKSYKKKGKSYKKKRTYKRKGKKATRNNKIVVLGQGLPKSCLVTHKYTENIVLTSTTGVMSTYYFSCNGMYDPNITGTGHQPMYFDQFAALYNHYTVIGSRIKIRCVTNTSTYSQIVGLFINDNTALTVTNISGVDEQSLGHTRLISSSVNTPTTLTSRWSAKKYFPGSVMANDNLQGTGSANPTEQSYYTICLQDPSASVTCALTIQVEIEYIAIWGELNDVAQS